MAKPYFVLFNAGRELVEDTYNILKIALETGKIIKGASNSIEAVGERKGKLVIIAEDSRISEAISHLPYLCVNTGTPVTFVPSKRKMGDLCGNRRSVSAVCITDLGKASDLYKLSFLPKLEKVKEERSIKY